MFNGQNYSKISSELAIFGTKILAATKTKGKEEVLAAFEGGIRLFGENYVLEAYEKYLPLLNKLHSAGGELHLIGHLQSNKAKKAVELFDCIETIDSIKIASKVNLAAQEQNKIMKVMIEVNFEEKKAGVSLGEAIILAQKIHELSNLKLIGLMCIPKIGEEESAFSKMQKLKQTIGVSELSMGMSGDYMLAAKHGATIVRLGTILFGEREEKN